MAMPYVATQFFSAPARVESEFRTGTLLFAVPLLHANKEGTVSFAGLAQTAGLTTIPSIAPGFGEIIEYTSVPMQVDAVVATTASLPDLNRAYVAAAVGWPIIIPCAFQGTFKDTANPTHAVRIMGTQLRQHTPLAYGSIGQQMSIDPAIHADTLPDEISAQLLTFETAITRHVANQYSLMRQHLPPGDALPSDAAIAAACTAAVCYMAVGGFGPDGRSIAWSVRDRIPFGVHILKHQMRQGQSRSVFAEDLLVWTVGPPSTSTDCLGADTATAITALLNWDLDHMPAWTAYLNTTNIIPQDSIEMVQAYFTLAGRRIPRTP